MESIKNRIMIEKKLNREVMDWNRAREHVFPVLRPSREASRPVKELINRDYMNIKIYYKLLFPLSDSQTGAVKVTIQLLERWGITEKVLQEAAMGNMKKDGYQIRDIRAVCQEMFGETVDSSVVDWEADMYVLSNKRKVEGAAGLLFTELIGEFAEKRKSDLYLLPSSTHELILIPKTEKIEVKVLQQMVEEVNETQVVEAEQLGNSIYFYSRNTQRIAVVA